MINDKQRIAHILQTFAKTVEATSCTRDEFLASSLRKDAISYNFLNGGINLTQPFFV